MIAQTITAINAALDNYPGPLHSLQNADDTYPDSRLLGLARPVFNQQENRITLATTDGETIADDDRLGWLSFHALSQARLSDSEQYGTFQVPYFAFGMTVVLLSRDPSTMGRLLTVLPTVPDVRITGPIEQNTMEVIKKYLGWPADKMKGIDPSLWAFAVGYAIDGVSSEDIAAFYRELTPGSRRHVEQF